MCVPLNFRAKKIIHYIIHFDDERRHTFFLPFFHSEKGCNSARFGITTKATPYKHEKNPIEFTWFFIPNVFTLLKGKQEEIVIKQDNGKKLNSNFATLSLSYAMSKLNSFVPIIFGRINSWLNDCNDSFGRTDDDAVAHTPTKPLPIYYSK